MILATRTCTAGFLTCPGLVEKNQFVSNTVGRSYFVIDIKHDEIHCKIVQTEM